MTKNSLLQLICQKNWRKAKVHIDQNQLRPIKCWEMRPTLTLRHLGDSESNFVFGGETSNSESETNLVLGHVMQKIR